MTNQEKFNGSTLLDHPEVLRTVSRDHFPRSLTDVFTPRMIQLYYLTHREGCDMLYSWASRRRRYRDVVPRAEVTAFLSDLCLVMFAGVGWIQRVGWRKFSWKVPYSANTTAEECVLRIRQMEQMRRESRMQAVIAAGVEVISETEFEEVSSGFTDTAWTSEED